MDLTGKIAMVTGGGRRVGRAIALALASAGCDVAIHYGHSADAAMAVAEEIRRLGRRAEIFSADLADPAAIESLFAAVGAAMGRIDVLVNSAGIFNRTPIETLTAEQFDKLMAINARAPALCVRHALGLMPAGGAVVNITDVYAEKTMAGYPAYCASKAALRALTGSMSKSLAPRGIRVNAVAPGIAEWPPDATEESKRALLAKVPMGRPGSPQGIASAVVFLARADYITGQTLRVDGGFLMS